jgi:heat shock protein HslJ
MLKRLAVLTLTGAALAACATPPPAPPPAPAFTGPQTFALEMLGGLPPAYAGVTLTLDGQRASGSTGCNPFLAVVEQGAAQPLRWFQVGEVACTTEQMALERAWLQAMEATASIEESSASLVLKDANGAEVARLRRQAPTPAGS